MNGTILAQVKTFKYLGTTISWNLKEETELNIRIAQAKSAFQQIKNILCNKNILFKTRYRVLNCYVFPIFTYSSETWTLNKRTTERIQAFEMWAFRKMMRISYLARKTNQQVLQMAQQNRSLLTHIKTRQMNFLGHVIRKGKLEHLSLSGKIPGKRARGKQRITFLQQIQKTNTNKIIHMAYNRQVWRSFTLEAANAWKQARQ